MLSFIKKLLGISDLEYKVRLLQRAKYWKEKYNGTKEKRT
tara:strand:- start:733 stop:852 length:120 start_codon:yes stop_codon:yes gene_type:complete